MANKVAKTDAYDAVTAKIVALLEAGKTGRPITWSGQGEAGRIPYNMKSGNPYRGVNVLSLWISAAERGYGSAAWLTYKQAEELGGQVRKGEKATPCVFFGTRDVPDESGDDAEETRRIPFAKPFWLFNADQVDGIGRPEPAAAWDPLERAEEVVKKSGADVSEGGTRAFYNPISDKVALPDRQRFRCHENFYVVCFHELSHWTGHKSRLARDLRNRFGTEAYAMEELVAELGSAFICAETGVRGELEHHANYLDSWLKVLKGDRKAIVTAASAAGKAAAFVLGKPAAPAAPEPSPD